MNPHSIFAKLNLLFLFAVLATVLAGGLSIMHVLKRDQTDLLLKSRLIVREYRHQHRVPDALIKELGLIRIPPEEARSLLTHVRQQAKYRRRKPLHFGGAYVFQARNHTYLSLRTRTAKLLLRQQQSIWQRMSLPLSIFGGLLLLLIVIYGLLRRSLLPIRRLQREIVRYGEGQFPASERFAEGKDEITEVGNAFYASATRVQRLIRSRQLFVRNIFHELNTPVTKGKLLAELVEEPKTQSMLDSIFSRLASLLKELAQMEQITSQDTRLSLKPVRILDVIDQARDLLYLDEPIPTDAADEVIEADFATMALAFKNLIDNARKYGTDLFVRVREGSIEFRSKGAPLPQPLSTYTEPFSQGDRASSEGFGLGLYIVHEIARKHGMTLTYRHEEGVNIFALIQAKNQV